jgi:secernin
MCDCLVALPATTDTRATLFAKNSDRPPDEIQRVTWSPPRRDRGSLRTTHISIDPHPTETIGCLLSMPSWCWGAEHGVNVAGVAIGNEAIYTTLDPRRAAPALIGMDLVRLGLERAHTASAAVEVITSLLARHGQGGTGHDPFGRNGPKAYWSSFLIADPTSAFVVETSASLYAVESVSDVTAISNRTTIASFDAVHRHPQQPVESLVDPRLDASRAVLDRRPVTVASLVDHMRSHGSPGVEGWSVCMHARGKDGQLIEVTTSSMIAELCADGRAHRAWVLLGSPCQHDYIEVAVGEAISLT